MPRLSPCASLARLALVGAGVASALVSPAYAQATQGAASQPATVPASAARALPSTMPPPPAMPVSTSPAPATLPPAPPAGERPGMHMHGMAAMSGMGWMAMPMPTVGAYRGIGYTPDDCGPTDRFDLGMQMCMPAASPEGIDDYVMIHGDLFGVGVDAAAGSRSRQDLYSTNMVMIDAGTRLGERQMLNADPMLFLQLSGMEMWMK